MVFYAARFLRRRFGFLYRRDQPPLVARLLSAFRVDIHQPEAVGSALVLIARAALLGDHDKAKRLEFTDGGATEFR